MTTLEICVSERQNSDKIVLYKEGIFYKAYEKSAYAFYNRVKKYEVKKKYVKTINAYGVSLGFPTATLPKFENIINITSGDDKTITIQTQTIDDVEFKHWKESIEIYEQKTKKIELELEIPAPNKNDAIVEKIKNFNVECKTPLECMVFISELKKECNNGGI
ncbi:MAG: hypothetical protein SNH01_08010 [Rikenellaceae bacterium]